MANFNAKIPLVDAHAIGDIVKVVAYKRADNGEITPEQKVEMVGVLQAYSIDTIKDTFKVSFEGAGVNTFPMDTMFIEVWVEKDLIQ